ncbi:GNAT family N-acetyltransferase [Hazenella sp. IB182357]|uniref:GNAT family N-acetyltransferase n=1 Tax=Polycladospora coralii TaxID=2771432 RepID=A0A926RW44_9BACL|nr:GNAT family N-acetyltransferase [Polycladospora coralii]MBD1371101.1 GNAT family N-acetyltransferase [Polycladospora coralii]MBS7530043.1 GNAT family N-acetyltransferase [Polycladospora coralii]
MNHPITLLNHQNRAVAQQIRDVQIVSYRVEAKWIQFDHIPYLKESINHIQNCSEVFIGCMKESTLAGVLSFEIQNHILCIHRLVVHPTYFRKGIGQSLLAYVCEQEALHYEVQTGTRNTPAIRLYQSMGFHITGEKTVAKDLKMSLLRREGGKNMC